MAILKVWFTYTSIYEAIHWLACMLKTTNFIVQGQQNDVDCLLNFLFLLCGSINLYEHLHGCWCGSALFFCIQTRIQCGLPLMKVNEKLHSSYNTHAAIDALIDTSMLIWMGVCETSSLLNFSILSWLEKIINIAESATMCVGRRESSFIQQQQNTCWFRQSVKSCRGEIKYT